MRTDPYAGHDPQNTRRFAGLVWLIYGLIVVTTVPVSGTGLVGLGIGGCFAVLGAALLRNAPTSYDALLGTSYAAVLAVVVLQHTAGADGALFEELLLVIALHTAAVHPARRFIPLLAVVAAAIAFNVERAGGTAAGIADGLIHLAIIALVAIVSNKLVGELREQRLAARQEEAVAQELAATDALTGLGNRRRLLADLERTLEARAERVLLLLDLDGFKAYNDTFGHPAGDQLLQRLGTALERTLEGRGAAYRMGGDEFCVLASHGGDLIDDVLAALSEHGDGFAITASHGAVAIPHEADSPAEALGLADRRMYSCKRSRATSTAGRQSTDVLLRLLSERDPELCEHVHDVERTCERVARRLALPEDEMAPLLQAAALHDIGKAAIPDTILDKPAPLDEEEWEFIRRHTLIGERIMLAAPALARAATYVRSSHERFDGGGYPDGLAGGQIPLGARIIAVCDAFEAMTSNRPYRSAMPVDAALRELRACSGTQFDPQVVEALCAELGAPAAADAQPLAA